VKTSLVRDAEGALRSAIPSADHTAPMQLLEMSTSSVILRFGRTIARVARNGDAQAGHQREAVLLPLLVGRLPVAIPVQIRLIETQPGLPFGAALQPWIEDER
jgi:hypothetical protein